MYFTPMHIKVSGRRLDKSIIDIINTFCSIKQFLIFQKYAVYWIVDFEALLVWVTLVTTPPSHADCGHGGMASDNKLD